MATSRIREVTGTATADTAKTVARALPWSFPPTRISTTPAMVGDATPDTSIRKGVAMQQTASSGYSTAKNARAYSAKDRIDNPHFGLGTIVTIDEHYTTIRFDENGTRKFVTTKVKLAPSETPKPVKRGRKKKETKIKKIA
jgi:hypothetical protein